MTDHRVGMSRSGRGAWTGLLLVAGLAMLGAVIGLIASVSIASGGSMSWGGLAELVTGTSPSGDFAAILGAWGFVSAGAILGGYSGFLVLALTRPKGMVCPRCGTRNTATASVCKGCDLELQ